MVQNKDIFLHTQLAEAAEVEVVVAAAEAADAMEQFRRARGAVLYQQW